MEPENVLLNVYDMHWSNYLTDWLGLGCYHSAVEVYKREYAFGGGDTPKTGIFVTAPRQLEKEIEELKYKMTIFLGTTTLSEDEVQELALSLACNYSARSYHLLEKNCNHFSEDFAKRLCGVDINFPIWVNKLAAYAKTVPWLIPSTHLNPPTSPPLPENTENACESYTSVNGKN
ncbi:deubiquitinase DESI2-like [Zophobas morio]|uniref:deubiquitinase DESI2-like n=1 Tax=Zophobas morio TaxID=2755281 RepID=UPI0030832475